jgi:hypothetical protein
MNTLRAPYCETDFGHRDPGPVCRFMDLIDGDRRVSVHEQQDYLPARLKKSRGDSAWTVVLLCLSPFIVIGGVSLIAFLIRT